MLTNNVIRYKLFTFVNVFLNAAWLCTVSFAVLNFHVQVSGTLVQPSGHSSP